MPENRLTIVVFQPLNQTSTCAEASVYSVLETRSSHQLNTWRETKPMNISHRLHDQKLAHVVDQPTSESDLTGISANETSEVSNQSIAQLSIMKTSMTPQTIIGMAYVCNTWFWRSISSPHLPHFACVLAERVSTLSWV